MCAISLNAVLYRQVNWLARGLPRRAVERDEPNYEVVFIVTVALVVALAMG